MATAPQISLRDGSGFVTDLTFTTNQDTIVILGTVGTDTAAVQISVNGSPFVSDSTLISFTGQSLTVPNLTSFPSGLLLELGLNVIQLRTIDVIGAVSAVSTVRVTRVKDLPEVASEIPTGVRIRRTRDRVKILAAKPILRTPDTDAPGEALIAPATTKFIGFNFYASVEPAGTSGYFKINQTPISASTTHEEDIITSSEDIALWDNTPLKTIRLHITEEDEFGNILATRLDKSYQAAALSDKIRVSSTLESYRLLEFVTFTHTRAGGPGIMNSDQFINVPDTDPLYYVVTGVYYDSSLGQELETPYSQEVLGAPLTIDTTVRDLPPRKSGDIVTSYIQAIRRVNTEIGLVPGTTSRDVSIDPFSSESERLWFLLDFIHRSQSFLTLLQIDDANGDGFSDAVSLSPYKIALKAALGLQTDDSVQSLIDQQFDKLAANSGKPRLPGRPATGQAVIYTLTKPLRDIVIPADSFVSADADVSQNLPSIRYRIAGSFILPAAEADAFYNFDKKRWQITVDIVAETIGSAGNRSADSIKSITGVSGVLVTNDEATVFGTDLELNSDLAARSILGFSAVDTGTEGGYASTAAEQPGIIKAKIVKSGDSLMMRDYDTLRKKHAGGKVDIYVQGTRERQISEKFAFTFEIARDVQCQIVDISLLQFRVLDSRVTPETPIIEILDNAVQGLGVRNVTTGQDYDLTGVVVLDYQTFQLNTAISQPATNIDDIITADYRFRIQNQFFFTFQPVRRVISVVGEVAGPLDPSVNFSLFKTDDPLLTGESTSAKDFLSVIQFGGKPSGSTITVSNDLHVLIGFFQEPLLSIGINTKTIRVFSEDRLTEYNGPETSSPDFDIILGTPTTPAKIVRTSSSNIVSGQTVSVDYVHDENFTVTYVINDLLQEFQAVVNRRRHVTADVLVKQAIENAVDLSTTIQLEKGAAKDKVDPAVRSNVSIELNRKIIGQGSAQSDIINAIDSTAGVDFQIVPFARMAYADGSRKLREGVLSTYTHLSSLDIGGNIAYLLNNPIQNPTTDGGGLETEHRGVFQDDEAMTLASSLTQVASGANQAWIIGNTGAIITGYSDDATLIAAGFTTSGDILEERLRRTANHVVVSLSGAGIPADTPDKHTYAVSYVVRGDSGSHDIVASQVEFTGLGALDVTYREGV